MVDKARSWRYLTGKPLNGQLYTNARWGAPGTQALTQTGYAHRWYHYPHRRVAALRVVIPAIVTLLLVGGLINWSATVDTLRVAAWTAVVVGGWMAWEWSRRYAHRRELIAPLGQWLADRLKDACYIHDPRTWIQVPVDVWDRPSRILLRPTYAPTSDASEKAFVKLLGRKIGLTNPSYTFQLQGAQPFLELWPAPAPRARVAYDDPEVRALYEDAGEGVYFFGLGPRDHPIYFDLVKGAPHIGWSMPTNTGKSTSTRPSIAKFIHDGGLVLMLDPKMDSQLWAADLAGVRYCDSTPQIHEALMWLSREIDRRNAIAKEHSDIHGNVDPDLIGPRLLVIAEEINTMEGDLAAYWRKTRKPGDPIKSDALTALGRALNMGRARRVYVWPIAQELLVQSLGGPAAKANLSTRVLGRARTPTWNKLAPECKRNGRYPPYMGEQGRVYVVAEEEAIPVQAMFMAPEDAREYAMSGVQAVFPEWNEAARTRSAFPYGQQPMRRPNDVGPEAGLGSRRLVVSTTGEVTEDTAPALVLVTLAEAADRLGMEPKSLRNYRDRAEQTGFPGPRQPGGGGVASKYALGDVEQWAKRKGLLQEGVKR